ncbi:MAG: DUF1080 domain-containing protein [Sedimentisphaerales bacterium]|nr:DUF1080 domain-containing protein [Sedimentisphaerales bacterium]
MGRFACVLVVAFALSAGSGGVRADAVEDEFAGVAWQSLFDGRTLDGWEVRSGVATYHVEDGAIVGTTVEGSPNTFLCTKKRYGDFILEFEVKVDPALNSGVQIRSNAYEKETVTTVWRNGKERQQKRPAGRVYGYQVEIASGTHSGGIYDEARLATWLYDAAQNPKASKAFQDNQWNKFRVLCYGDLIKTWVNGVPCTDMRDPVDQAGFIGLQVHGYRGEKPAQVRWRNLRIKDRGRHVWKALGDAASLAGWDTIPGGKWEVRDGAIVGTNVSSDPRHGLLISKKRYGDFTVDLKFKAVKGNSGLYFRSERVAGSVGVHGFQAEIDASQDVGGLYETGGRAWVVQPSPEDVKTWFKPGQWNRMTVSAHGHRVVVHVNGQKSAELVNDPGRLEGYLGLQLHGSQDVEVQFKELKMLTPQRR